MEGFVTLREAAAKIGRSTARTRQYVHSGQLKWQRDEMGHLMIDVSSLAQFTPPERGEARAGGISAHTQLRHARAALKLVSEMAAEGPAKATAKQVLSAIIANLAEKAKTEDVPAEEQAAAAADAVIEDVPAEAPTAESLDNLLNKI